MSRLTCRLLSVCAFGLLPLQLSAAQTGQPATAHPPAAPVGMGELTQVVGALVLVLALIAALAWFSQRLRLGRGASGRYLKVVDALAVGTRERLLLVEVDGERVLIGCAGGRLERLHVSRARQDFGATLAAVEQSTEAGK